MASAYSARGQRSPHGALHEGVVADLIHLQSHKINLLTYGALVAMLHSEGCWGPCLRDQGTVLLVS